MISTNQIDIKFINRSHLAKYEILEFCVPLDPVAERPDVGAQFTIFDIADVDDLPDEDESADERERRIARAAMVTGSIFRKTFYDLREASYDFSVVFTRENSTFIAQALVLRANSNKLISAFDGAIASVLPRTTIKKRNTAYMFEHKDVLIQLLLIKMLQDRVSQDALLTEVALYLGVYGQKKYKGKTYIKHEFLSVRAEESSSGSVVLRTGLSAKYAEEGLNDDNRRPTLTVRDGFLSYAKQQDSLSPAFLYVAGKSQSRAVFPAITFSKNSKGKDKVSLMYALVDEFNESFGDVIRLSFSQVRADQFTLDKEGIKIATAAAKYSVIKSIKINIVNRISSEKFDAGGAAQSLKESLCLAALAKYGFEICEGDTSFSVLSCDMKAEKAITKDLVLELGDDGVFHLPEDIAFRSSGTQACHVFVKFENHNTVVPKTLEIEVCSVNEAGKPVKRNVLANYVDGMGCDIADSVSISSLVDVSPETMNLIMIEKGKEGNHKYSDKVYKETKSVQAQHITKSRIMRIVRDPADAIAGKILTELAIKKDVSKGVISLRDMSSYEGWVFAEEMSNGCIAALSVCCGGSFEVNMYSSEEFALEFPSFSKTVTSGARIKQFIALPDKTFLGIEETDIVMMPDEAVHDRKNAARRLRSFLCGWLWRDEKSLLYATGKYEVHDIRERISKFPNVRRIYFWNEAETLQAKEFRKLFVELLSIDFVRADEITVLPFPFKYLREWTRLVEENTGGDNE